CAVMIIGITEDGAVGVPPVEMLELQQVIQPFLGVSGPEWDVVTVLVGDSPNVVLVVIVEPPEPGQPPFICRSNGEGLQDGRIYVRAEGETREAKAEELDQLLERGRATAESDVRLEVSLTDSITPVALDTSVTIEEYIDRARARLLAALPGPSSLTHSTLRGSWVTSLSEVPEDRTEGQYQHEIEDWAARASAAWPAALERFLGMALRPIAIRIENLGQQYLEDVQVSIHLEGEVHGVEYISGYYTDDPDDRPAPESLGLPGPPRAWGPRPNPAMFLTTPHYPADLGYLADLSTGPRRLNWNNSGSVDIRLDAGDIRPQSNEEFHEEEVALVLWAHRDPEPVRGSWSITARGHHHVYEGELSVALGNPFDANALLRSVLFLEDQ